MFFHQGWPAVPLTVLRVLQEAFSACQAVHPGNSACCFSRPAHSAVPEFPLYTAPEELSCHLSP